MHRAIPACVGNHCSYGSFTCWTVACSDHVIAIRYFGSFGRDISFLFPQLFRTATEAWGPVKSPTIRINHLRFEARKSTSDNSERVDDRR